MQSSARSGVEASDRALVDLGRDFERARAKLGQLRTSFDGRCVSAITLLMLLLLLLLVVVLLPL